MSGGYPPTFTPTRLALIGSQWPQVAPRGTLKYTSIIKDDSGNFIPAASLNSLTLTLIDAQSGNIVNNVNNINILNTGRGTVDALGNLTVILGANPNQADTALIVATDNIEIRSMVFNWTYNGGNYSGYAQRDFVIGALST
jgi:hypothetical protein